MRSCKEIVAVVAIVCILLINGTLYLWQSRAAFLVADDPNHLPAQSNDTAPENQPHRTANATVFPTPSFSIPSGITAPPSSTVASPATPPASSSGSEFFSGCDLRTSERSAEDGLWYNFSTPRLTLYAYTAFVDDRASLESEAVVRIVAVADVLEDMKPRPLIHCRFYYALDPSTGKLVTSDAAATTTSSSFSSSSAAAAASPTGKIRSFVFDVEMEMEPIRNIGMGWWLNKKIAREYVLTCPLPGAKRLKDKGAPVDSAAEIVLPVSTAIVIGGGGGGGGDKGNVSSCLPVERPKRPSVKKDFVLCVQVAFGKIDPMRLIEWLELQRLLGVGAIGLYDQGVHAPAKRVMRHYADLGLVDLRKSDYIPDGPKQYLLHGSPVINDCMFRHMHSADQLLVYDIDEVILPRIHNLTALKRTPFQELLKNLKEKYGKESAQYMFRNSYFFLDIPPDNKEPKELTFLRYKMTAPLSGVGYSAKSLVGMESCIQMHNHYCWGSTRRYEGRQAVSVDPELAKNQHYKWCHFSEAECEPNLKGAKPDESILPYREELIKRVSSRVEEIKSKMRGYDGFLDNYFKKN